MCCGKKKNRNKHEHTPLATSATMGLPTLASNPSQPPKDLEQPMKSISQVNILEAKPDVLETERRKASFLRQYTPVPEERPNEISEIGLIPPPQIDAKPTKGSFPVKYEQDQYRLSLLRSFKNPFIMVHKPHPSGSLTHPSKGLLSKSLHFQSIVAEQESYNMSFLTENTILTKKDYVYVDSNNEKLLFILRTDSLSIRLYKFFNINDLLTLLSAIKPQAMRKSFAFAHRIFKQATDKLLWQNLCENQHYHSYSNNDLWEFVLPQDRLEDPLKESLKSVNMFRFWNLFIYFEALQLDRDFNTQRDKRCISIHNIEDDIGRTLPQRMKEVKVQCILRDVLVALANSLPQLGYIQGLNTIVGALIVGILDLSDYRNRIRPEVVEQVAYGCIKYFLMQRSFITFYTDGFKNYSKLCKQLSLLLSFLMPTLSKHFAKMGFDVSILTMKWFFTLFATVISVEKFLWIWNRLLLHGFKVLLEISLGLLHVFETQLLKLDMDGLYTFFSDEGISEKIDYVRLRLFVESLGMADEFLAELESKLRCTPLKYLSIACHISKEGKKTYLIIDSSILQDKS